MLRAGRKCTQHLLQPKPATLALDWLTYSLVGSNKAELPLEGIFFRTQFSSLGIFINKKVGNQKN